MRKEEDFVVSGDVLALDEKPTTPDLWFDDAEHISREMTS